MSPAAPPLEKGAGDDQRTYAQTIQSQLADDILNGKWAPGTRLKLQALCDTYEVSMSPLREALAALAGRGLVAQEGQRGFRVAPVSEEDLDDVTETRIHIEAIALRLSIENGDDGWEAAILAAHHRLSRNPRSDKKLIDPVWEELHRSFHVSLINACGLQRLLGCYRELSDDFDRYRRLAVLSAGHHPRVKQTHGAIVKAVLARDTDRSLKLLSEHVRDSAAQIKTLFGPQRLRDACARQ
ncbi:MAG TPA: FCD domain-containing protein [Pseudolabrys sp.]|nr:FCD domain-containing protein [Pseudolabrys sp.]